MQLKLNKKAFARKHKRERESRNIFNKTSGVITNIMPFIIPLFFAPVLITTSLFSKEIVLMLANTTLGLGYLSNFIYRLFNKEVSKSEFVLTTLFLVGFLTLSYFLYPPMAAVSFIGALGLINQMTAAVNLFFLIKNVVIPPFKRIIEKTSQFVGFDISASYYNKAPMTLEDDRYVIDRLLVQTYGYDSFNPKFEKTQINSFNKLLNKLCSYINKYDDSFLGYFLKRDAIADIESQINVLTTHGNPDSAYTFIRRKIGFKTTKVNLLEAAKNKVLSAIETPSIDAASTLHFFTDVDKEQLKTKRNEVLFAGLHCLQQEIKKQKNKISSLEECLPDKKDIEMVTFKVG